MHTTLIIKDLSLDHDLSGKAMSAVRGGNGNQANATQQLNKLGLIAPVLVGNGSTIAGGAMFQVDSNPTQTATNDSTSTNSKAFDLFAALPLFG